jgi:hypothetical protein
MINERHHIRYYLTASAIALRLELAAMAPSPDIGG